MIELIKCKKIIEVFFSGRFIKKIHEDIFGKDMGWKDSSFTECALLEFLREKEQIGGKRFLLSKLSRRALLQLKAKALLIERCISEEMASEIVASLSHFFDDSYLIEGKIRGKLRKNYGRERIRHDLWEIPDEEFDAVFEKLEFDPINAALSLIRKIVKDPKELEIYPYKEKLIAKLFRRGHDLEDIHKAIEILIKF